MSDKKGTVSSNLPKMIVREKTEANTTIPPLPKMPEEFKYGGEWMDPPLKKTIGGYKKLFSGYPLQMVAIIAATICLAIALASLSSTACSGGSSSDEVEQPQGSSCSSNDSGSSDKDELLGTEAAVSGNIGELYVAIKGYKIIEDYDGNDAIMVEYELTNNSSETTAFYFLQHRAFQNDVELEQTYGKTDEFDNQEQILEVLPGGTHTVHCLYKLNNTTDEVNIVLNDYVCSDVLQTVFHLDGGESKNPGTDSDEPANTGDETAGYVGDYYITVERYMVFEDDWGDQNIVVNITIRNDSDEEMTPDYELMFYAWQSGEELSEDTFFFDDYDATLNAAIQPGETGDVYVVFGGVDPNGAAVNVTVCDFYDESKAFDFHCNLS